MTSIITPGQCRCGIQVNRIENCPYSARKDGVRYDYTARMSKNVNIFRCCGCERVIYDSWRPLKTKPAAKPKAKPNPPPENVRQGAPYDNPAFEQLARNLGVWGTAQSALCAQFWLAAKGQPLGTMQVVDAIRASGYQAEIKGVHLQMFRAAESAHSITLHCPPGACRGGLSFSGDEIMHTN